MTDQQDYPRPPAAEVDLLPVQIFRTIAVQKYRTIEVFGDDQRE